MTRVDNPLPVAPMDDIEMDQDPIIPANLATDFKEKLVISDKINNDGNAIKVTNTQNMNMEVIRDVQDINLKDKGLTKVKDRNLAFTTEVDETKFCLLEPPRRSKKAKEEHSGVTVPIPKPRTSLRKKEHCWKGNLAEYLDDRKEIRAEYGIDLNMIHV